MFAYPNMTSLHSRSLNLTNVTAQLVGFFHKALWLFPKTLSSAIFNIYPTITRKRCPIKKLNSSAWIKIIGTMALPEDTFISNLQHISDNNKETLSHKKIELKRLDQNYRKTKERLEQLTRKLHQIARDRRLVRTEVQRLKQIVAREDSLSDPQMSVE